MPKYDPFVKIMKDAGTSFATLVNFEYDVILANILNCDEEIAWTTGVLPVDRRRCIT